MNSEKRSKRHHYVPKTLLKRFSENGGARIWYSERGKSGFSKPELRNIDSCFQIRNYYTIDINGKPSDVIEREFYGELDNTLGFLLKIIDDISDIGFLPRFSPDFKGKIVDTVLKLLKRSPQAIPYGSDEEYGHAITSDFQEQMPHLLTEFNKAFLASNSDRPKKIGRHFRLGMATSPWPGLSSEELDKFKTEWMIPDGKGSFILSSRIMNLYGPGPKETGEFQAGTRMLIPVKPNIALMLVYGGTQGLRSIYKLSQAEIRNINEIAVRNSTAVASHSEQLLKSITGHK